MVPPRDQCSREAVMGPDGPVARPRRRKARRIGRRYMRTQTTTKVPASTTAWSARPAGPLSDDTLELVDAWWRAANYLSIGQIYLLDNPLLRRPLSRDDVKPRLVGHWGTTPGLNFLYAHLNRAINERSQSMIYVTGPG